MIASKDLISIGSLHFYSVQGLPFICDLYKASYASIKRGPYKIFYPYSIHPLQDFHP